MLCSVLTREGIVADVHVEISKYREQHCPSCYSVDSPDGNLNIESLAYNLKNLELLRRWVFIHDRIAKGEIRDFDMRTFLLSDGQKVQKTRHIGPQTIG